MSKKNTSTTLTYESAYSELEAIVQRMQQQDLPISELNQQVQRATELIEYCRTQLRQTGMTLQTLQESMNSGDSTEESSSD